MDNKSLIKIFEISAVLKGLQGNLSLSFLNFLKRHGGEVGTLRMESRVNCPMRSLVQISKNQEKQVSFSAKRGKIFFLVEK
jgi:hypothetical protein